MSDHSEEKKDFQCDMCSKKFGKSATCYNHKKQMHNFKHPKDNERGRPVKTESKPFIRNTEEILENPRKMMQDRSFPDFAKLLLRMVREEKKGKLLYEQIFIEIEKFETNFQEFVDKNYLNCNDECLEFLKRSPEHNSEIENFFRFILENYRLTLKLTDEFARELCSVVGFYLKNLKLDKINLIYNLKQFKFDIIGGENIDKEFLDHFITILISWTDNYKLKH